MQFSSSDNPQPDRMTLDEWLIADKNATYIVRMEGDAMQDSHILSGDYLLVLRTDKVSTGDIVLALQEDEPLIRYLQKTPEGTPYLTISNTKIKTAEAAKEEHPTFTIEGKIICIIRKIENTITCNGSR